MAHALELRWPHSLRNGLHAPDRTQARRSSRHTSWEPAEPVAAVERQGIASWFRDGSSALNALVALVGVRACDAGHGRAKAVNGRTAARSDVARCRAMDVKVGR